MQVTITQLCAECVQSSGYVRKLTSGQQFAEYVKCEECNGAGYKRVTVNLQLDSADVRHGEIDLDHMLPVVAS